MEHVWTVLATKALIDQRTRMPTLFEVCDAIETPKEGAPSFDPNATKNLVAGGMSLELASFWMRSDYDKAEKGMMRYVAVTPDGKRFAQQEREVDLTNSLTSRTILIINSIIFRGFGLYFFLTEQKKKGRKSWSRVAKVPLLFRIQTPPPTPGKDQDKKKKSKRKPQNKKKRRAKTGKRRSRASGS